MHSEPVWKFPKCLGKTWWCSSILQRRSDHHKPPGGSQGQRLHHQKVGSYTDASVVGIMMISKLVNPQEHLEKVSRNILRPPLQYITIVTPQVIQQPLITSV